MIKYKHTMHLLHLILTLIFLPWAIIWVWRTLSNAQYNKEQMFHAIVKEKLK